MTSFCAGGGPHHSERMSQAVMEAARRELTDFHARVLPVCDKLDNMAALYVVRSLTDVQQQHSM